MYNVLRLKRKSKPIFGFEFERQTERHIMSYSVWITVSASDLRKNEKFFHFIKIEYSCICTMQHMPWIRTIILATQQLVYDCVMHLLCDIFVHISAIMLRMNKSGPKNERVRINFEWNINVIFPASEVNECWFIQWQEIFHLKERSILWWFYECVFVVY